MCQRQAIISSYTTKPYHSKPKKTHRKRNLVPLVKPDRKLNVQTKKDRCAKIPHIHQSAKLEVHNWQRPHPGGYRYSMQCVNQPGLHARKSDDVLPINTLTSFPYSLYKSHRRFRILCKVHTIRQRMSRRTRIVFWLGWEKLSCQRQGSETTWGPPLLIHNANPDYEATKSLYNQILWQYE